MFQCGVFVRVYLCVLATTPSYHSTIISSKQTRKPPLPPRSPLSASQESPPLSLAASPREPVARPSPRGEYDRSPSAPVLSTASSMSTRYTGASGSKFVSSRHGGEHSSSRIASGDDAREAQQQQPESGSAKGERGSASLRRDGRDSGSLKPLPQPPSPRVTHASGVATQPQQQPTGSPRGTDVGGPPSPRGQSQESIPKLAPRFAGQNSDSNLKAGSKFFASHRLGRSTSAAGEEGGTTCVASCFSRLCVERFVLM